MENIHETIQDQQAVLNFITMSQDELGTLANALSLQMTVRDLRYCQNQYRMRERRNPTLEELRMLDAIYGSRTRRCEHQGLRAFYTSDPIVAETYADLIAKASHLRRENRPYTPLELSGVLTRSLEQAGKTPSVPTLRIGSDAPLRLLTDGCTENGSAMINGITAVIGQKNSKLAIMHSLPQQTDQLILLTPSGMSSAAFAATIAALPLPNKAQMVSVGARGLLDALLTWNGVYLVWDYLPGIGDDAPLAKLITSYTDSMLILVDGEHAAALRDAAAAVGLTASIIGKYTPNQRLTIRRNGCAPLQIETAFLRAFSPILPADAEIPGTCMQADNESKYKGSQTIIPSGDCALFSAAIPDTPYAVQHEHLLTGASSHPTSHTFRTALLTTLFAINRAVAAGIDYNELTLSKQIYTPRTENQGLDMGETMSALLGCYRAQAELALPDVGNRFAESADGSAHLTVITAAKKSEQLIPHHFVGAGNNVYLLTPLSTPNFPVDFEDYRKLLRYVHRLCLEGIALSAIAIGENGVESAIRTMTQEGSGFAAVSTPPSTVCAFLIETKQPIQGMLIGVTTASPVIRIGEAESSILNYRFPKISADLIPMSDVGTAHPILCLPRTRALGNLHPVRELADRHHAVLESTALNNPNSRSQLREFANTMAHAHITVLVGTGEEIECILSNRRVQFAKQKMLSLGGLLLCLHTDRAGMKNEAIPADHPLFFGTPEILLDGAALSFDPQNDRVVHMRVNSPAIPRMLACGIAYFQ